MLPNLPGGFHAIDAPIQLDIHQNQIEPALVGCLYRLLAAAYCGGCPISQVEQFVLQTHSQNGFIFDDQNIRWTVSRHINIWDVSISMTGLKWI